MEAPTVSPGAASVSTDVAYQSAWLTWVAATTTCLRSLGTTCDQTDVAGMSGYAFLLTIHEGLCPCGPTGMDWGLLMSGLPRLGRSPMVYWGGPCGGTREHRRHCYEFVRREIEAGRPCVLWGAYAPEFSAVVGVADGAYQVHSFREAIGQPQPPVRYDELHTPGGVYALAFPTAAVVSRPAADRGAICHALQIMRRSGRLREMASGLDAYDQWTAGLAHTGHINISGNAYNAQCWAEARSFARDFVRRIAARDAVLAEPLEEAHEALSDSAAALWKVAQLFPFPGEPANHNDESRRQAASAMAQAKAADAKAIDALAKAAEV